MGFQNQVQTEPLLWFLSQNVTMVVTYVAMLAGCDLVNVVCYHVVCHTSDTLTSNRTKVSPQVNDVLTPRACQALLAYTLILEEPIRCIPSLFYTACIVGQVGYRALYPRSCVGYVTGIFYRIGLVQVYLCTLLPQCTL